MKEAWGFLWKAYMESSIVKRIVIAVLIAIPLVYFIGFLNYEYWAWQGKYVTYFGLEANRPAPVPIPVKTDTTENTVVNYTDSSHKSKNNTVVVGSNKGKIDIKQEQNKK